MPRLLAFRATILIVPIVLAALPARAAGRAAHAMTAPGHVPSGDDPGTMFRTVGSGAGLPIEPASGSTARVPAVRSPDFHRLPSHRFPRFSSRRTPALAAPPPAATPIQPIPICLIKPMHLADFLLQSHSAFHLADRLGPWPADAGRIRTRRGWISFGPVPMT